VIPSTTLERAALVLDALERCAIPHALGGALAYGIHAEPRATFDVDVNVFVPSDEGKSVIECLAAIGATWTDSRPEDVALREGQARLALGGTFVDLFFADFPFFDSCAARAVTATIGPIKTRRVLSAEDLVVCKAMFNRPKDWIDIRQVLLTQGERFDDAYVAGWLRDILGAGDPAVTRFESEVARARADLPG
jgi:hypothetical protein